ncbi:hypothetical protein GCM10010247_22220 [Streptomyces calvus]|nr:hypothetical protein GCM10010247_22220 [Streptomyces calvus]
MSPVRPSCVYFMNAKPTAWSALYARGSAGRARRNDPGRPLPVAEAIPSKSILSKSILSESPS